MPTRNFKKEAIAKIDKDACQEALTEDFYGIRISSDGGQY
jgi:hypothetical protein